MFASRLSACTLLAFVWQGVVLGTRPEDEPVPCELFDECEDDSALELLQKKAAIVSKAHKSDKLHHGHHDKHHKKHKKHALARAMHTTTATMTTSTTTTTDVGPAYLITSSRTTGHIYSWTEGTPDPHVLIDGAGKNPSGIALDPNLGYIYYTDPVARKIVRWELEIHDGHITVYDQQPVPIVENVDCDSIAVNEFSNLFWTDPVTHSIKKIYKTTIDLVAEGFVQPNALTDASYMDVYKKLNQVPSLCYNAPRNSFPRNCSANVTCNLCKELSLLPYIYTLYTDMGHPSGMQVMPGNRMLWGNMVDGYHRGSVVEALNEPFLLPGEKEFPITPRTYLWDSVFNFVQLPDNPLGGDILFIATNGTLGVPPIKGDVVGAIVAITPNVTQHMADENGIQAGASEAIVLDWNLDEPRSMVWNGHEKLYVADNWGIRLLNSGMLLEDSPETKLIPLPGASGLVRLGQGEPCYPMMVSRGSMHLPGRFG